MHAQYGSPGYTRTACILWRLPATHDQNQLSRWEHRARLWRSTLQSDRNSVLHHVYNELIQRCPTSMRTVWLVASDLAEKWCGRCPCACLTSVMPGFFPHRFHGLRKWNTHNNMASLGFDIHIIYFWPIHLVHLQKLRALVCTA